MKKILIALIVLMVVVSLVGTGTRAWFSDTEQSTGNVFSAGTLDLKLSDPDQTDLDGVTVSWIGSNLAPGGAVVSGWVDLKNTGSLAAHHLEISFANTISNVVTPAEIGADDTNISDSMKVTAMSYGTTNLLAITGGVFNNSYLEAADTNNSDTITLDELNGFTIDNLTEVPAPNGNSVKRFSMSVQLDSTTGNGNQGDSLTTVITFALNQDSSQ